MLCFLSLLLLAASAGSFFDYPPLKFLVKTHAHRAILCGVSVYLLLVQAIAWSVGQAIAFVVIGTLFVLGHVAASIVSCFQHDKLQETLISQDIRTSAAGETSTAAALQQQQQQTVALEQGTNSSSSTSSSILRSVKPGIVETSFNEV
jgi:uncharacterized iron-regulated membrane protein